MGENEVCYVTWMSPRISFSNGFAHLTNEEGDNDYDYNDGGGFNCPPSEDFQFWIKESGITEVDNDEKIKTDMWPLRLSPSVDTFPPTSVDVPLPSPLSVSEECWQRVDHRCPRLNWWKKAYAVVKKLGNITPNPNPNVNPLDQHRCPCLEISPRTHLIPTSKPNLNPTCLDHHCPFPTTNLITTPTPTPNPNPNPKHLNHCYNCPEFSPTIDGGVLDNKITRSLSMNSSASQLQIELNRSCSARSQVDLKSPSDPQDFPGQPMSYYLAKSVMDSKPSIKPKKECPRRSMAYSHPKLSHSSHTTSRNLEMDLKAPKPKGFCIRSLMLCSQAKAPPSYNIAPKNPHIASEPIIPQGRCVKRSMPCPLAKAQPTGFNMAPSDPQIDLKHSKPKERSMACSRAKMLSGIFIAPGLTNCKNSSHVF